MLSTHTMRDILQIADKALVLHERCLVFDGGIERLFNTPDLARWDLDTPLEIQIARILRQNGIPLPHALLRWEAILNWLSGYKEGGHGIL